MSAAAGRAPTTRRICLSTLVIAAVAAYLAGRGWAELRDFGLTHSISAGRWELAGPVVLGFVLAVFLIEQARPAVRRPLLARGHLIDMCYLLAYALVVVPLIVLIGSGFSAGLARLAPWLVLPAVPGLPGWCFVVLALVAIDFTDWLAHLGNHRVTALWRLHAVHHSQEELSILTTFRAHPLVHVSFLMSAIPILAISSNAVTPTAVLTAYACLGALPHANVRWTYGPVGKVVISPAYHRIHHAATGRIDINLGTVLAIWDVLSRRAVFPAAGAAACRTGLDGRPIPVEQAAAGKRGAARAFLIQFAEPFQAPRPGLAARAARQARAGAAQPDTRKVPS
ncbi:MAG TPA: sterol desaturase family protein [Streptosporangiaceae bacterium]|nr:sterol desaturase family protein [Streptosporangiaceae bacterium]